MAKHLIILGAKANDFLVHDVSTHRSGYAQFQRASAKHLCKEFFFAPGQA